MFKKPIIDATATLDKQDEERTRTTGERGASSLGTLPRHSLPGARRLRTILFLCGGLLGLLLVYRGVRHQLLDNDEPELSKPKVVKNNLPPLHPLPQPPAPELPPPSSTAQADTATLPLENPTPVPASSQKPPPPSPAALLRQRRLTAPLVDKMSQQKASHSSHDPVAITATQNSSSESDLQHKMKPLRLNPSFAGILSDRDYLLTQGAMIDCVLETRLISTQPGMTACQVTRDIYSTNGQVILIDRGSKIVGQYQGGLNQGQARIFVLWSRIETPQGVIINLDSPGTGSLGEGGVGGYVDTHFWERFGGAILLSLIDDVAQGVVDKSGTSKSRSSETQIQFSNSTNTAQDMAAEALKNSINIPPTLYKNQGERVSIFVARDLDFRGVYDLRSE